MTCHWQAGSEHIGGLVLDLRYLSCGARHALAGAQREQRRCRTTEERIHGAGATALSQ